MLSARSVVHRKRVTPDYIGISVSAQHDFDAAGIAVRQTVGAGMA